MRFRDKTDWKNTVIMILDVVAVNFSYLLALLLRLYVNVTFNQTVSMYLKDFSQFAIFYTIICLAVFSFFKLYNGMWRYAGLNDLNRIIIANLVTTIVQVLGTVLFIRKMPISYYVLGSMFQLFFILCLRFGHRIILMEKSKIIRHCSPSENVMIVGTGRDAARVIDYIENNRNYNLRPVCIIDDKSNISGKTMNGIPVIGGIEKIEEGIEKYRVTNVCIADPLLDNDVRKHLESICQERYINLKDYGGYLLYLQDNAALFQIVKAPTVMNVKGREKRIIPFSPPDVGEREIGEVTEALHSGWITTGPRTKMLERRLTAYIETGMTDIDTEEEPNKWDHRTVCLSSATAAEELNLRVFGVGPGDEVIVPAYTYTASASAAIHCGAKVVFVDIQKNGDAVTHMPEMDYDLLESAINEKTKAIIVVDLGGIVADYKRVFEIVERKKYLFSPKKSDGTLLGDFNYKMQSALGRVAIIADSAHSLGASRIIDGKVKYSGRIADFTSYSFHAVKNFTTAEGGASTWNLSEFVDQGEKGITSSEIYHMYQLLSLHGQSKDALAKTKTGAWEYDVIGPWYKCNMTDIMAAIGLRQLDRYKDLLARRAHIVSQYDKMCDRIRVDHLYHHVSDMNSSNHLYIIRVPGISNNQRNSIIEQMAEAGIATNVHYKPLPMMTAYQQLGWNIKDFPNSYSYYENLITLPLHTLLSDEDVNYVCETFSSIIRQYIGAEECITRSSSDC